MKKLKFLTVKNCKRIEAALRSYIYEVIQDEEYLNTFKKVAEDARRVECYNNQVLTPGKIADYLRGLPLSTAFETYTIVQSFFCKPCNIAIEDLNQEKYKESYVDLDDYYWSTLGRLIYENRSSDKELKTLYRSWRNTFNYDDIISSASYVNIYGNPTYYITLTDGRWIELVDDYSYCTNYTPVRHHFCDTKKDAKRIGWY